MLPQNVLDKAQRLGGEPAWNAGDARTIVLALALDGTAIVEVEAWREHQGQPQWVSASNYSTEIYDSLPLEKAYWCAIRAGEFIEAHRHETGAWFKLTWATKLNLYSKVRLLTDSYQLIGASKGDTGTIIEVYPNGGYEVEFSKPNGTTYAQIVANEEELELAEPIPIEPTLE